MPPAKKSRYKAPASTAGYKLTDDEFWSILRENGGIFARTARAIEAKYKVPFTRQSVKARADGDPKMLDDIREQNIDTAEETLVGIMRTGKEHNRLDASKFVLKSLGRKRGYNDSLDVTSGGQSWAEIMREFHEKKDTPKE